MADVLINSPTKFAIRIEHDEAVLNRSLEEGEAPMNPLQIAQLRLAAANSTNLITIDKGISRVPEEIANHWYAQAHGVKIIDGVTDTAEEIDRMRKAVEAHDAEQARLKVEADDKAAAAAAAKKLADDKDAAKAAADKKAADAAKK